MAGGRGEIGFEGVSLDYTVYHDRTLTLYETVINLFNRRTRRESFRALDDVSFHLSPGESVAMIGANGAGKSTTLKLLAGIYEPTRGRVSVGGRVASLLDLGVGFHPELTGAENVYLNGALLGIGRSGMRELLPRIVEFAGLERFLDTPVKYYSAGMFMRLGFSLATAVEPDVLLIDEVLAVGDAAFQRKCYDRIYGYKGGGRTILFVSHDLEAVARLCDRAIWLDAGRIRMDGRTHDVLAAYSEAPSLVATATAVTPREWGSREVWMDSVSLGRDAEGPPCRSFRPGEKIVVRMDVRSSLPGEVADVVAGFSIHRPDGSLVIGVNNMELDQPLLRLTGRAGLVLEIDLEVMEPGNYVMGLALTDPGKRMDYHWRDFFYPFTLEGERKEPPMKLRSATWKW
ncbi:ABC transporter ATP-binding protein [Candidatus Fermentibacterales bacterium]|nr:ABC transporter ATP-binding protein [Candidatus Fermentibacterales bacterium]